MSYNIKALADQIGKINDQISQTESDLAALKERREALDAALAAALDELGMDSVTLSDGRSIEARRLIVASPADRQAAAAWLMHNGHADVVEQQIIAHGLSADELARLAGDREVKLRIHPQRLNAIARELLAAGETLPESFGVHEIVKTRIKRK